MDGVAENIRKITGLLPTKIFDVFPSNIFWSCWLAFGWLKMNGCVWLVLPNCNWRLCPVGADKLGRCCGSPVAGLLISMPLALSTWLVLSPIDWPVNNVELDVGMLDPKVVLKLSHPGSVEHYESWILAGCLFAAVNSTDQRKRKCVTVHTNIVTTMSLNIITHYYYIHT